MAIAAEYGFVDSSKLFGSMGTVGITPVPILITDPNLTSCGIF